MDDSYIHQAAVYAFEGLECEQKHHYQAASQAFTKAAETLLRGLEPGLPPYHHRKYRG
eukprot:m.27567 g.27567  ORF g.27567 m.27567 type:complete len:58 (-) comp11759_c0_seq1:671-844(-)